MRLFAQITDTHLDGGPWALARTRAVMTRLRDMPLDAILVTGDVVDHGAVHEYEQAAAELAADVPVLILPGNHDERTAFRKVLLRDDRRSDRTQAPINAVHRVRGVTVALCDSSIPGRSEGRLAPETLDWLRSVLVAADGPVLVCLHHPPVPTYHPLMDEILLTNPDDLAAVLADGPGVVAVLCGHGHQPMATTFAGRPLVVAQGVISTLRLTWAAGHPRDWDDAVEPDARPGIAFHVVEDDGRVTTHFRTVPV